jgi:hypothetical protein
MKLCHATDASEYVSGSGGRRYIDEREFKLNNITLLWQEWLSPNHDCSLGGWRDLSFLDYVAHFGPNELRRHLLEDVRIHYAF